MIKMWRYKFYSLMGHPFKLWYDSEDLSEFPPKDGQLIAEGYFMTNEDLQKMWDAARSQRLERIGSGTGLIPGPFDKNYGGIVLEFKDLEEYMETLSVDKERSEL